MRCVSVIFLVFMLFGITHAIPDPSTTVHIQNYHGPVYFPPGCGCPYHNDDQCLFLDTPSTAVDSASTGVTAVATATSEVSSQNGVTKSGTTAESTVVTGKTSRGMTSSTALDTFGACASSGATSTPVVTITAYGTPNDDCCCVNRHQSDCVPINGATQCSSNPKTCYPSYSNPGPYYKDPETYYNCPGTDRPDYTNNYRPSNNCGETYNTNFGTGYTDQRPRTTYDIPRTSYGLIHNKPAVENNSVRSYNTDSPRIDFNCVGRDVDRTGTNYYFEGSVEGYPVKDTALLGYGIVKKNYGGCQCGCQNRK